MNKSVVKLTPIGGQAENGKSMYCLEIDDQWFIIDAGYRFPEVDKLGVDVIIPNFDYLKENKSLNLNGLISFRLTEYTKYLDTIIDICVNKFVIDREYFEFVNLLKTYVLSSPSNSATIHLVYKNNESILLDENKNIIPMNNNIFNLHYLSDISFSSNDYALNNLLTLLPKKLYIHLIDKEDEFITTLENIFDNRISLCHECDICKLYKIQSNLFNRK